MSSPALPLEAGYYDTGGSAHGICVLGGYAYVADYTCGLQIIRNDLLVSGSGTENVLSRETILSDAYPNPFNPQTTISFDLPRARAVSLSIYDLSGRLVDVLLDDEMAQQGRNEVVWTGRDQAGRQLPSGTYFYRLEAGAHEETKKMVLVK